MIDERDFSRFTVRVLSPQMDLKGTGFWCHPFGYIITCFHVIKEYIEEESVVIEWLGESLSARICNDLSVPEKEIAILQVTSFPSSIPVLPLDVNKRWAVNDPVLSHGFPEGSYGTKGVSVSGTLGQFTEIESIQAIQLISLAGENITYGFSGSPVWDQRLQRVIGMVCFRASFVQAFAVPLGPLFDIWPELEDFHDVFKAIRSHLLQQFRTKLHEKLKAGNPYIKLELQKGAVPNIR